MIIAVSLLFTAAVCEFAISDDGKTRRFFQTIACIYCTIATLLYLLTANIVLFELIIHTFDCYFKMYNILCLIIT